MNTFRNVLLGTAAAGLAAMAMSPANAAETTKTFKVSGWVNRVLAITDDGDNSYVDFADNKMAGSRFRMIGESKGGGLTVGARIELGLTRNQDKGQSNNSSNKVNSTNVTLGLLHRNAFVYFKSKKYGTLALGLQSTATDGTAEIDLSGTKTASYNTNVFPNNGYIFLQTGTKAGTSTSTTGPKVGKVFSGLDGNSRQDAIRYTTPSYKGFKIDVSTSQGGDAEAAIKYSGKFYNTKVAAALGFTNGEGTSTGGGNSYVGTVSALHASGLNATFSYGQQEMGSTTTATSNGIKDATNVFGKIGYQLKVFGAGKTSLSVSYQKTDNKNVSGDRAHKWGVEAVQKLDGYSTELIAAYTKMELSRTGTAYNDIDAGWVGARVKF